MTRAQLARRVQALEDARRVDAVPMTIGIVWTEDGRIVGHTPPRPIDDYANPNRRIDYRRALDDVDIVITWPDDDPVP